jgi:hypothetical protein
MTMLTISGSLPFDPNVDPVDLLPYVAEALRSVKGRDVTISGESVSFRGGVFRLVTNRNILVPFGRGVLTIDPLSRQVRYELSFAQLFVFHTVFWGFVTVMMLRTPQAAPPIIPVLAWILVIAVNLLIGLSRFRSFLRKAVDSAPVAAR